MNNIYADLLCDHDSTPKPRGKTTREAIEPSTFTIIPMSYQQLYDMAPMLAKRRDDLLQAYRNLAPEQQANVREELAELEAQDIPNVTEEEDARLSRPFPY